MPLLTAEAAKLSLDQLRQGVIENIVTSDELYALLPFIPVNGKAYVYNREKTLGTATFVDTDDPITEDAATFDKITAYLKRVIGDVDVDDFLQATYSDVTDQAATQIAVKSKTVGRAFADKVINGDETGTPEEFDGLLNIIAASQLVDAGAVSGAPLAFSHLDQMIDLNKIAGPKCFIMNSRTLRSYLALVRALGGVSAEQVNIPGIVGAIPAYRGVPILKNDYVPINQSHGSTPITTATTIFMATLDETEGLTGLMASNQAGIDVKVVGPVQNKDATRYRVRWYTGLALHSELALSGVEGINN